MSYEMTPDIEEAVISLIDEQIDERIDKRIEIKTAQQTHRMDRLENALVQLTDAQNEGQRHISHQLYILINAVNNLTNIVNIMQGDIRRLDDRVSKLDASFERELHLRISPVQASPSHVKRRESRRPRGREQFVGE